MRAQLGRVLPTGDVPKYAVAADCENIGRVSLTGEDPAVGLVISQDSDGRWLIRPTGDAVRFYLDVDATEPPGTLILATVRSVRA